MTESKRTMIETVLMNIKLRLNAQRQMTVPQTEKVVDSVYTGSTRTSSACFGELQGQKVLFITSAHYSGDAQQERSGRSFVLLGRSDLNAITPNQYFDGRHLIVA